MKKKFNTLFFYLDIIFLIISISLLIGSSIYFTSWVFPILFFLSALRMIYNIKGYIINQNKENN
ncbi:hypothetical protein MKX31_16125 [Bacillus sp. FSL M8-0063]|uniref:hypothetical protein n=1 Tax=Bacillus sp. FSL M8-0063 TaxID=2921566 RepID=UPI0030FA5D0A